MIIFDVEASGLSEESYPIEIAWQDTDSPNEFDSFLIKPASSWTYWDEKAETKIHHISRDTLFSEGINADKACCRLNQKLTGKTIYSDAFVFDKRWILKLFANSKQAPSFNFGSIYDVIDTSLFQLFEREIEREVIAHRALSDVRQIIRLLDLGANQA